MIAPLYLGAQPPPKVGDGHRGLWYDRFFDRYSSTWTLDETSKKGWIETVTGKAGDRDACEAAVERVANLCSTLSGETRVYAANWHFATGLGNPHPVENGFLWHPTLGMPYIAGSAVKGLVRAWVEAWMEFEGENEQERESHRLDTLYRWFGSEDKDFKVRKELRRSGFKPPSKGRELDTEAGAFVFFDALPVEPVTLKPDVMTPHMGKWYEQGGEISSLSESDRVPADWHNPIPVCFLVADRPRFQFAVAPRAAAARAELPQVMEALGQAIECLGAGAKTAVGYGTMGRDEGTETEIRRRNEKRAEQMRDAAEAIRQEQERQAKLAQMDPLEREIEELLHARPDKNQSEISALFGLVKQGKWQGGQKQRVAQLLANMMKATDGEWKQETQAKRPDRDRKHQNTLQVIAWLGGE